MKRIRFSYFKGWTQISFVFRSCVTQLLYLLFIVVCAEDAMFVMKITQVTEAHCKGQCVTCVLSKNFSSLNGCRSSVPVCHTVAVEPFLMMFRSAK